MADKRAKSGEKVLATHPDGGDIIMTKSRFGFSLYHKGEKFYTPKGTDPSSLKLDELLKVLEESKKRASSKSNTKKVSKRSNTKRAKASSK